MSKVNQLKAGAILSYIQMFLQCIISLSYTPMMIAVLGDNEYGIYSLVTSIVSYLSLLNFGFGSAYIRFFAKYRVANDKEKIESLNGMFLSIFFFFAMLVWIVGYIIHKNFYVFFSNTMTEYEIDLAKSLLKYMIFNMGLSFIDSVFTSFVTSHEKFVFQKMLNMLKTVILPCLIIIMLKMNSHSMEITIVTTIFTIIGFICNVLFCILKLKIRFKFGQYDFGLLKEIAIFSGYIAVSSLIDQINWNMDKIILGKFHGTVAVAIYSTASQINSLIMQFSTNISNVFTTKVNELVFLNKNEELSDLFIKIGRIQFIVLSLVISGYIIFGEYFITEIFAKKSYAEAYYIGLLLIIPVLVPLIQNIGIEIQRAMFKHKFRTYTYLVMALVNILVSIPLGKRYSGIGVAFGTTISIMVANGLIMNIYYSRVMKLDILRFWKRIFSFFPALVLPMLVGGIIKHGMEFLDKIQFVCAIIIYVIIYGCSMWFWGLNKYEKRLLKRLGKKKLDD